MVSTLIPIPHQFAIRDITAPGMHQAMRARSLTSWIESQARIRNIPPLNDVTVTLRVIPENSRPLPNYTPMLTAAVFGLLNAGIVDDTYLAIEDSWARINFTRPDLRELVNRFFLKVDGTPA